MRSRTVRLFVGAIAMSLLSVGAVVVAGAQPANASHLCGMRVNAGSAWTHAFGRNAGNHVGRACNANQARLDRYISNQGVVTYLGQITSGSYVESTAGTHSGNRGRGGMANDPPISGWRSCNYTVAPCDFGL